MSTFPKHDLLGDDEPVERAPIYDRLTVPSLADQQGIEYCAWCEGSGVERPETVEARACRHCGGDGAA